MRPRTPRSLRIVIGLTFLFVAVLVFGSSTSAREKWGPFRGRVVDIETGQPIAGAVVLFIWWEAVYTPVQTNQKFYEAQEAVTDADGRFEIPRLSPPFFSFRIFEPTIDWFAPGYVHAKLVVTPQNGEMFVDPTVIQMRQLKTREERVKNLPSRPGIPPEKMREFIRAMNTERQALGFSPYPIPGDAK